MHKNFIVLLALAFVINCPLWLSQEALAQQPPPLEVDVQSAVLMEVSTGATLFEYNADQPIEPASFTKVLTLYVVFESLQKGLINLRDEIYISEKAWRTGGSKMFVEVGSKVPLEDLIQGIAVVSGNDACVAVAEQLYGSVDAFVNEMNRKTQTLGMTQSHFENPHGLPAEGQMTTARDMAILDAAYLKRFPHSLKYHSMREYTYNNITQHNRNRLLFKDPSVDGLKTGYVSAAGYHLSATGERDGMRLLAVVMGAKSPVAREREALKLLNYGFRNFALIQPFPKDQPVATVKVWKGLLDSLDLFPAEEATLLVTQKEKDAIRWQIEAPAEVTAPIANQQELGKMVFYIADQPKKTVSLVSHQEIARAGWFKSLWQSIVQIRLPSINWHWLTGVSAAVFLLAVFIMFVLNRRSSRRSKTFRR
ncbi:D-alanyl-D-alanine carboxypeptidase family protein [Desulfoferrobacter suflitae]|uniref:D-alanyl-D-alanine carboxypeptidase family protein n=1 Tax=Desulfoferrobacter suflitae TaxID=2865782 RepID=UPI0021640E79|nr:D-alanyl-D-alanine carboxypeptidase family protein [Desulfoferrobacter suflitae]MCK8601054.1 D-alanyl-D-alanine carboxypeptidase [Desulfoferrobacter suflitae]